MDKIKRIPHEGIQPTDSEDGLNVAPTDTDTEGHRVPPGVINRGPGTAGDLTRRPSGGGELIDENDVEGHSFHQGPGTCGDFSPPHRPGSGELIDDTDVTGR
jgi:hypothetical protein